MSTLRECVACGDYEAEDGAALCHRCDPTSASYDPLAVCPKCGGDAHYRESLMQEMEDRDARVPADEVQPSWCVSCQDSAKVAAWGAGR